MHSWALLVSLCLCVPCVCMFLWTALCVSPRTGMEFWVSEGLGASGSVSVASARVGGSDMAAGVSVTLNVLSQVPCVCPCVCMYLSHCVSTCVCRDGQCGVRLHVHVVCHTMIHAHAHVSVYVSSYDPLWVCPCGFMFLGVHTTAEPVCVSGVLCVPLWAPSSACVTRACVCTPCSDVSVSV